MNTSKLPARCLVLALLLYACKSTISLSQTEYPAALTALSHQQLQAKTDRLQTENNSQICSKLNKYALTIGKGCFGPKKEINTTISQRHAVAIAKKALVKNKLYTNVFDSEKLKVNRASAIKENNSEWRIDFLNQVYRGYAVNHTPITVWLNAQGAYRINGHWYKKVVIPDRFNVSRKIALKTVIGYKINYSDWTGPKQLVINNDILPAADQLQIIVFPYQQDNQLQLHLVWKIKLTNDFAALFVDAMNKKVVGYKQLILF